jgi:hypothetical protein
MNELGGGTLFPFYGKEFFELPSKFKEKNPYIEIVFFFSLGFSRDDRAGLKVVAGHHR